MPAGGNEHGAATETRGRRNDDVRGAEDCELFGRQRMAQAGSSECHQPADGRFGIHFEQVAGDETAQAVAYDVDARGASGVADLVDDAAELPREFGVVEPRLVGEGDEVPETARGEEAPEPPEMTRVPEETVDEHDRRGVRRGGIELRGRRERRGSFPRGRGKEGDEARPDRVEAPVREPARDEGREEGPDGCWQSEGHALPGSKVRARRRRRQHALGLERPFRAGACTGPPVQGDWPALLRVGILWDVATEFHPARWWHPAERDKLRCTLCPRYCLIGEGQAGFCYIRQNHGGQLWSTGYGQSTGFAADPIEKKPLNHYLPGERVLSFGTAGCNLGCKFCQNWNISKAKLDEHASEMATPEEIVALARRTGCTGIAYTYNDPVIWAEFVIDIARVARAAGLANILVTAGYVTAEARAELFEYIDATNVDLKGFTEEFYHRITLSHLEPVLDTLVWLKRETRVWTEVTTLLIPGLNDGDDEIARECDWFLEHLGPDVPLHFTAFHPDFKLMDRPRTPAATLSRARRIARARGLRYCYVGNVHDAEGQTTFCPGCGVALIERDWHAIHLYRLDDDRCPDCGTRIPGRFHAGRHRGRERNTQGQRFGVSLA